MRWDSSTKLLRNLCRYEKRRNKRPKIKVRYIQFSNKSFPRKESGKLRKNRHAVVRRKQVEMKTASVLFELGMLILALSVILALFAIWSRL